MYHTGDHMLLLGDDVTTYRLKLVNFAHSFLIGTDSKETAESLRDYLPPYLIPPEVIAIV